jgi:tRNA pseudouridine55 synthase
MELAPAGVVVHRWDVRSFAGDKLAATITCGGGTYIRALARDMGRMSGSAAHLASLRRTRIGKFDVADAVPADALRDSPPPLKRLEVTVAPA